MKNTEPFLKIIVSFFISVSSHINKLRLPRQSSAWVMQKYRNSCYWTFKVFFPLFVLGFGILVGVLGVFLSVAFKSRDTAFIQTVLILEEKTSILSKTQSFWLLLDFWGRWWGFVGLFALWFWGFHCLGIFPFSKY